MEYNLTQKQKEELEKIGELYRNSIYDSSLNSLPDMVKAFANGLSEIDGDISSSIAGEVFRFQKLISSLYTPQMRKWIDGLYRILIKKLPKNVFFTIVCRQKSWESALRKILKYYFLGDSIILPDLVALRITVDSILSEEEQKVICHEISNLCLHFFIKQQKCRIMPPSKRVADNPLLKDYIDHAKSNGYQSIHLAFMDISNNIFEVQIRTQLMDVNAEYGPENSLDYDGCKDDVNAECGSEKSSEKNLNHNRYKDDEYKEIIPFISFDPKKVNKPFFRTYTRVDKLIITDRIGLIHAKPIEERAHTY